MRDVHPQQAQVGVVALTLSSAACALVVLLWIVTFLTRAGRLRSSSAPDQTTSTFLTRWMQVPPPRGHPGAVPYPVLKWRPRAVNTVYVIVTLCIASYACTVVSSYKYERESPEEQQRNTVSLSLVLASILLLLLLYFGVKARGVDRASRKAVAAATTTPVIQMAVPVAGDNVVGTAVPVAGVPAATSTRPAA